MDIVSVPYGDLFYFYRKKKMRKDEFSQMFPSPMGIFFISIYDD